MHLALAAYMWGRLTGVFFLVSLKLCFYYSLSVEITQKPPNLPFLGFPRALYRNSAQIRKNSPVRRRTLECPRGGIKKKDRPGTSGRLFWDAEGVGAEVTNTQERTTTSHGLPHVDTAGQQVQGGPALRTHQAHGSRHAQADMEGN